MSPLTHVPFASCDGYILGLDRFMALKGQSGMIGQTVIVLKARPDVPTLQKGIDRLLDQYRILRSRITRVGLTRELAWNLRQTSKTTPEVRVHPPHDATQWQQRCRDSRKRLSSPYRPGPRVCLDVIPYRAHAESSDKTEWRVLFTWSHLVFDGMGAGNFIGWIERAGHDVPLPDERQTLPSLGAPGLSFRGSEMKEIGESMQKSRDEMWNLRTFHAASLGMLAPFSGETHVDVQVWDEARTAQVKSRMEQLGCALLRMPFFAATALRTHQQFTPDGGAFLPIPVQIRNPRNQKKNQTSKLETPQFQNAMRVFFLALAREELQTFPSAIQTAQAKYAQFLRQGSGIHHERMMWWMRRLPASLIVPFARSPLRGELATCFHSDLGELQLGTTTLGKAEIENAWHIPALSSPPGSGLFFSEYQGKLSITHSWCEGVLNQDQRDQIWAKLREDLLGDPPSEKELTIPLD